MNQQPNRVPILGGQHPRQPTKEERDRAMGQAVQQLSLGIYSRAAAVYVVSQHECPDAKPAWLEQLAKDSMTAAKCYFEGLGLATFSAQEPDSDSDG